MLGRMVITPVMGRQGKWWQERWVKTVEEIAASLRHAGLGLRASFVRGIGTCGSVTCVPTVPSALLVRFKALARTHRYTTLKVFLTDAPIHAA